MATQEIYDANILDREDVDWRKIVYPLIIIVAAVVVAVAIYYYQAGQSEQQEFDARQAIASAKSASELAAVADKFPKTMQAVLALLGAADFSMAKRDFESAGKYYQRVIDGSGTDTVLRDSARLGLASVEESQNKEDPAIQTYLQVARRGTESPYAPYAYLAAARMDEQKHDQAAERNVLTAAAGLNVDSPFVKEAAAKLKELNASHPAADSKLNPPPTSAPH